MDGPYFDTSLIGPDGKLSRLCKGGAQPKPPPAPAPKGEVATNTTVAKERDPSRRMRGASSTILTKGMNTGFGSNSILGG